MDDTTLPLEGLYLHLLEAGLPLSVRDYEDALSALRRGHGAGRRDRLLWLVRNLWARSDQEAARIEAVFRLLPQPSDREVQALTGSAPDSQAAESTAPYEAGGNADTPAPDNGPTPLLEFGPAEAGPGGLPSLRHGRPAARQYVYEPRPLVSQRALTIAWRRLRRTQRSGPRIELDLDATISERCRSGWLMEPVLVPARRNQTRLVVLVDVSASMLPWQRMNGLLAASLQAGLLAHTRMLYFDNDPREALFDTELRTGRHAFEVALREEAGCAALIVGDAGAARGRVDRDRVVGMRDFLRCARASWPQLAWLNPMPRRRWLASSAGRLALDPSCAMFEFDDAGLARAIHKLRS